MAVDPLAIFFRSDGRAPLELVFADAPGGGETPDYALSGGGPVTGLRRASAKLVYDINVQRPALALRGDRWQDGRPMGQVVRTRWERASELTHVARVVNEPGAPASRAIRATWQDARQLLQISRVHDQVGVHVGIGVRSAFEQALELSAGVRSRSQPGVPVGATVLSRYQETVRLSRYARSAFESGRPVIAATPVDMQPGVPIRSVWRVRFQRGRLPLPGGLPPGPGPDNRDDWCYVPANPIELLFEADDRAPLELVFRCERGGISPPPSSAPLYILPARYFMQVHSLVAHRLPDLADVPIFDVSLSADAGSYAWTFSASAPVSVFDQLAPVSGLPQQIRITLDGIPFLFVVDSLQHEEAFGRRSVRISGRSITALVGSPFARSMQWLNASGAATAQQLALQALDLSGVALSWGLEDWLVPAGAWSHSGTPLSAVQAIVEAAGGYLQSARNAATLIAMHPYPTLTGGVLGGPWNWYASGVVPDVELAPDALVTTAIERIDGADINAVYVSGETQGVSRLVKRTGTAANKLASPVVSALITSDEAARQRGTAILGAAGPKHMVRATLPLLTGPSQPGILDVGQLIQVNAAQPWRGRVRSVSVAASFGAEVRQSVQIERHLEPA